MLAHKVTTALFMKVVWYDINPNPPLRTKSPIVPYKENPSVTSGSDLKGVLESGDFVAVTCNLSENNKFMFGAQQFAAMKKGAYFINTSRGKLVVEDALADALDSGSEILYS